MVESLSEIENQNCPNDKAESIWKCFESCKKINIYVLGKKDPGMDEFMPMFTYSIIQVVPNMMFSNIEYLKLYLDEKLFNQVSFPISIIEAACQFIISVDLKNPNASANDSSSNNVQTPKEETPKGQTPNTPTQNP